MSLSDWLDSRWIVRHDPDAAEIAELFGVVTRDLQDAAVARLSADWRLGIRPEHRVLLPPDIES